MNNITLDDLKKVRNYYITNVKSIDDTATSIALTVKGLEVRGEYKEILYSVTYNLNYEDIGFYAINVSSGIHYTEVKTRKDFIPRIKGAIQSIKIIIDKS